MIPISNTIKDLYKAYNREIKCYGELYFKKRRMSNNLLDTDTYVSKSNLEYIGYLDTSSIGNHYMFFKTIDNEEATEIGYKLYNNNTLIDNGQSTSINNQDIRFNITNNNANKIMIYFNTTSNTNVIFNIPSSIGATDKFTLGLKIGIVKNGGSYIDNIDRIGFYQIYIAKEHNILEFEPRNEKIAGLIYKQTQNGNEAEHLTLSPENNTEILSFDLDLKTDAYYTSLPYNTLEIEINNEVGYFSDYDENSITSKLNSDCFINLYLQIDDGENLQTFKLMTMNFDKISYSDYEKAKLEFKSCLSYISKLKLKDKFEDFTLSGRSFNVVLTREYARRYLLDNYNIKMTYEDDAIACDNFYYSKMFNIQDMILNAGTCIATGNASPQYRTIYLDRAVITTNNSNDEIALRKLAVIPQEYITQDYELEKPIIKRENSYDRLKYTYESVSWDGYEATTETYKKTITGILSSQQENILLIDNDYKLNDITTSDITTNTGITISIPANQFNPRMLVISINGNVDNEYSLTIEKANVYKKVNKDIREIIVGNKSETEKTLEIKENSPLYNDYFQIILYDNKILSNVEVKLMALPYLELGDTIAVEIDNAYITMTISEIKLSFGDGLIQTIKGYRLGWLYPDTTLYPSEELYPNTPDINKVS